MNAPAVVIRLELEASVVVYADCLDDREEARLADWIGAHPAHAELVERARALAQRREAA